MSSFVTKIPLFLWNLYRNIKPKTAVGTKNKKTRTMFVYMFSNLFVLFSTWCSSSSAVEKVIIISCDNRWQWVLVWTRLCLYKTWVKLNYDMAIHGQIVYDRVVIIPNLKIDIKFRWQQSIIRNLILKSYDANTPKLKDTNFTWIKKRQMRILEKIERKKKSRSSTFRSRNKYFPFIFPFHLFIIFSLSFF